MSPKWLLLNMSEADERMLAPVHKHADCTQFISLHRGLTDRVPPFEGVEYAAAVLAQFQDVLKNRQRGTTAGVVVAGDRVETLMVAAAARQAGYRLAHIGGGETHYEQSGHWAPDHDYRWAIARMACIHFVAPMFYKHVVEHAIGFVYATGLPSLDAVVELNGRPPGAKEFDVLVCLHPTPGDITYTDEQDYPDIIAQALHTWSQKTKRDRLRVLVSLPGPDRGADALRQRVMQAFLLGGAEGPLDVVVAERYENYLHVLRTVDVAIGNSSSFILEAGVFGTPVVCVGSRNRPRLRSIGSTYKRHIAEWPGLKRADSDTLVERLAFITSFDRTILRSDGWSSPQTDPAGALVAQHLKELL